MANFYRMQVFAGLALLFVIADTVLLAERGNAHHGELLEILPWIIFPPQITLLAIWMTWPVPQTATATAPEQLGSEVPHARNRSLVAKTLAWNPARFGLGAAGISVVGGAFVLAERSRFSLWAVLAVVGVQLAVILTLTRTGSVFLHTRQFRLWDLLMVVTLVATTAGLLRFVFVARGPQESLAGVVIVAAFHSIFSQLILAGLSVPGWRAFFLGLPLALGMIALLLVVQVAILALITANDPWSGLVVVLLAAASLIQTAIVLVALVFLRMCGVIGTDYEETTERTPALKSGSEELGN